VVFKKQQAPVSGEVLFRETVGILLAISQLCSACEVFSPSLVLAFKDFEDLHILCSYSCTELLIYISNNPCLLA
jgi:hypothetical protein